jgi:hypothetical protein
MPDILSPFILPTSSRKCTDWRIIHSNQIIFHPETENSGFGGGFSGRTGMMD